MIGVDLLPPGVAFLPRHTVHAFGDESSYGDVTAYGRVAVHADNMSAAERLLSELKRHYESTHERNFTAGLYSVGTKGVNHI